ncbi:MAG: DUF4214 domain-containing protein [Pseudomonadota bacterium]
MEEANTLLITAAIENILRLEGARDAGDPITAEIDRVAAELAGEFETVEEAIEAFVENGDPALQGNLDTVRTVVTFYQVFLGRLPDPGGLDFWVARFQEQDGTTAQAELARAFSAGPEFEERWCDLTVEGVVREAYRTVLGRDPLVPNENGFTDTSGFSFWVDVTNDRIDGLIDGGEAASVAFKEAVRELLSDFANANETRMLYEPFVAGLLVDIGSTGDSALRRDADLWDTASLTELLIGGILNDPVNGTVLPEIIEEGDGDTTVFARGGDDLVFGFERDTFLESGELRSFTGAKSIVPGVGDDIVFRVADGDGDRVNAAPGENTIVIVGEPGIFPPLLADAIDSDPDGSNSLVLVASNRLWQVAPTVEVLLEDGSDDAGERIIVLDLLASDGRRDSVEARYTPGPEGADTADVIVEVTAALAAAGFQTATDADGTFQILEGADGRPPLILSIEVLGTGGGIAFANDQATDTLFDLRGSEIEAVSVALNGAVVAVDENSLDFSSVLFTSNFRDTSEVIFAELGALAPVTSLIGPENLGLGAGGLAESTAVIGDRFLTAPTDDVLSGNVAGFAEFLASGAGDDEIDARGGDDLIEAGPGDDTLTGGEGSDTFVLFPDSGTDQILDFQPGVDGIGLAGGLSFDAVALAIENGSTAILFDETVLARLDGVTTLGESDFVVLDDFGS